MNDPKGQTMFKKSRLEKLSVFVISPDYCQLPKKTLRANGHIYHNFKHNKSIDLENVHQDEENMDTTLMQFKYLTKTCWKKKSTSHY